MTLEPGSPPPEGSTNPAGGWREALADGSSFTAAYHAFLTSGDPVATGARDALASLADVETLLREKAWVRALRRFRQIDERPAIVAWDALDADLERLSTAGEALDRRRPDAAVAELDGLTTGHFRAEAETLRGTALTYDERLSEAAACFQRALDVDPLHYRALTNLGNVALEEGRVDDAISAYQTALRLNDDFANAHHNLAVAYRRKGQLSKSVSSLKRAQRLMQRRDASDAREQLGSLTKGRASRLLRWLFYAAAAVALYLVLHARGTI